MLAWRHQMISLDFQSYFLTFCPVLNFGILAGPTNKKSLWKRFPRPMCLMPLTNLAEALISVSDLKAAKKPLNFFRFNF
jgi:hypothetical protein